MLFLTFSNAYIQFAEKKLTLTIYTTKEALSNICWIKLIYKNEFAKAALDENVIAFMVHISSLGSKITIYPAQKA